MYTMFYNTMYTIYSISTTFAVSTSEIQAKYSGKVVRVEAMAPRKKMENIVVVLSELCMEIWMYTHTHKHKHTNTPT